jgi:hypothetical protein
VDAHEPYNLNVPPLTGPPLPPRDYSAAYVEELIIQHEWAMGQIQLNLNRTQDVLEKLRAQIRPH